MRRESEGTTRVFAAAVLRMLGQGCVLATLGLITAMALGSGIELGVLLGTIALGATCLLGSAAIYSAAAPRMEPGGEGARAGEVIPLATAMALGVENEAVIPPAPAVSHVERLEREREEEVAGSISM
jgi:hypothetical protein